MYPLLQGNTFRFKSKWLFVYQLTYLARECSAKDREREKIKVLGFAFFWRFGFKRGVHVERHHHRTHLNSFPI